MQHPPAHTAPSSRRKKRPSRPGTAKPVLTGVGSPHARTPPWVQDLVEEAAVFPLGTHDDQVDALTQAAPPRHAQVRDYINEALTCLRVGARRATVAFVWTGAVATLRDKMWLHGAPAIDAAIKKHRPTASDFKMRGDFAYVNDDTLLQVAEDLSVIDKSEKKQLKQALDLRNDCGHPVAYKPGEKRVSAFIEDVIGIVWK